ncbi:MAG: hypothetical protein H0V92_03705 [Pseudonocardiales bacterium]|nr:hypothetical protein [Pseudonocardiales bacterium]
MTAVRITTTTVRADHATNGIALTGAIGCLTALAGVLVQPLARRLEAHAQSNRAGITGLLVLAAGLVLAAVTAHTQDVWLLVPCAIVLGGAYGLCLVAGLIEVQRLAEDGALAGLTAAYYALTYLGFGAPYLLTLAAHLAGYPVLLTIAAVLALGTSVLVARPPGCRSTATSKCQSMRGRSCAER